MHAGRRLPSPLRPWWPSARYLLPLTLLIMANVGEARGQATSGSVQAVAAVVDVSVGVNGVAARRHSPRLSDADCQARGHVEPGGCSVHAATFYAVTLVGEVRSLVGLEVEPVTDGPSRVTLCAPGRANALHCALDGVTLSPWRHRGDARTVLVGVEAAPDSGVLVRVVVSYLSH